MKSLNTLNPDYFSTKNVNIEHSVLSGREWYLVRRNWKNTCAL